jgi:hypothetical protein
VHIHLKFQKNSSLAYQEFGGIQIFPKHGSYFFVFCVRQDFEESSNCQGHTFLINLLSMWSLVFWCTFFAKVKCTWVLVFFFFSNPWGRLIGYTLSMLVCQCDYFFWGRWI